MGAWGRTAHCTSNVIGHVLPRFDSTSVVLSGYGGFKINGTNIKFAPNSTFVDDRPLLLPPSPVPPLAMPPFMALSANPTPSPTADSPPPASNWQLAVGLAVGLGGAAIAAAAVLAAVTISRRRKREARDGGGFKDLPSMPPPGDTSLAAAAAATTNAETSANSRAVAAITSKSTRYVNSGVTGVNCGANSGVNGGVMGANARGALLCDYIHLIVTLLAGSRSAWPSPSLHPDLPCT